MLINKQNIHMCMLHPHTMNANIHDVDGYKYSRGLTTTSHAVTRSYLWGTDACWHGAGVKRRLWSDK